MKTVYDFLVGWAEVLYQYRKSAKLHRNHY